MVKFKGYQMPGLQSQEKSYMSEFFRIPVLDSADATYISWIYQEADLLDEMDQLASRTLVPDTTYISRIYQEVDLLYETQLRNHFIKRRDYYINYFRPRFSLSEQQLRKTTQLIEDLQMGLALSLSKAVGQTTFQNTKFQQVQQKFKQAKCLWEGTLLLYRTYYFLNRMPNLMKPHKGSSNKNYSSIGIFWEQVCLSKQKQK